MGDKFRALEITHTNFDFKNDLKFSSTKSTEFNDQDFRNLK